MPYSLEDNSIIVDSLLVNGIKSSSVRELHF